MERKFGHYFLETEYDARKSFYKKAKVEIIEDIICYNELLYSYGTLVAIYSEDKIKNITQYTYCGKYSQTTTRHQKEFFRQKGLTEKETKTLMANGTERVLTLEKVGCSYE